MRFACSLIVVKNVAAARFFYENVLGQKVRNDFGDNVVFDGDFAIHSKAHFRKLIPGKKMHSKHHFAELYFETTELEKLTQKLDQYGVEIIHQVRVEPWGQKVIRFYDPDGNMIEAGEPMEVFSKKHKVEKSKRDKR